MDPWARQVRTERHVSTNLDDRMEEPVLLSTPICIAPEDIYSVASLPPRILAIESRTQPADPRNPRVIDPSASTTTVMTNGDATFPDDPGASWESLHWDWEEDVVTIGLGVYLRWERLLRGGTDATSRAWGFLGRASVLRIVFGDGDVVGRAADVAALGRLLAQVEFPLAAIGRGSSDEDHPPTTLILAFPMTDQVKALDPELRAQRARTWSWLLYQNAWAAAGGQVSLLPDEFEVEWLAM
jgi:hypothetical protein